MDYGFFIVLCDYFITCLSSWSCKCLTRLKSLLFLPPYVLYALFHWILYYALSLRDNIITYVTFSCAFMIMFSMSEWVSLQYGCAQLKSPWKEYMWWSLNSLYSYIRSFHVQNILKCSYYRGILPNFCMIFEWPLICSIHSLPFLYGKGWEMSISLKISKFCVILFNF